MRAFLAHTTVVALAILATSGCRSSGAKSMWPFGRNKGYESSMDGPQLPSAGAMSDGASPESYNYNAPPPSVPGLYDQTSQGMPPANAYPSPGGYPAGATAGNYPPATAGYGAPGTTPDYGVSGANYGAAATASAAGAPGYGAVMPQTGPYNQQGYGQPQAYGQADAGGYGQPAADPYGVPAGTQPYDAPPQAYAAQSQNNAAAAPYGVPAPAASQPMVSPATAGANPGPVVTNPYATAGTPPTDANAYATTAPAGTADAYASTAQPPAQYTPEAYGDTSGAAGQQAADRYAASGATGQVYQPGNTGYTPGSTGYSPPGVQPYQTASAAGVATAARPDPYYRPGSTSDYLPGSNSQSPAGPVDRYDVPATANAPGGMQGAYQ